MMLSNCTPIGRLASPVDRRVGPGAEAMPPAYAYTQVLFNDVILPEKEKSGPGKPGAAHLPSLYTAARSLDDLSSRQLFQDTLGVNRQSLGLQKMSPGDVRLIC